jgi:hypothetical protein
MKERPSVLGAIKNRKPYKISSNFILDEGMKAVNFEKQDFRKNGKELLCLHIPSQINHVRFIAGDIPFCDNAILLGFLKKGSVWYDSALTWIMSQHFDKLGVGMNQIQSWPQPLYN